MPAANLDLAAQSELLKGIEDVGKLLVSTFTDLKSTLQNLAAPLVQFVQAFNPGLVMLFDQAMRSLSATVGQILAPALESLTRTVRAIADLIFNLPAGTKKLIGDIVTAATSLVAFASAAGAALTVAGAMLMPLGWMAAALAKILPLVLDLVGGFKFFSEVADVVSTSLENIWEAGKEVANVLLTAVGTDVQQVWQRMKEIFQEVADIVLRLILVVGEMARQLAKGGLDVGKAWDIAGKQLDLIRAKQRLAAPPGAGPSSWAGLEDVSKRISAAAMASGAAANMGNAPKNDKERQLEAEIEKMRAGGPGDNALSKVGNVIQESVAKAFQQSLGWLQGAIFDVGQALHINLKRPPGQN